MHMLLVKSYSNGFYFLRKNRHQPEKSLPPAGLLQVGGFGSAHPGGTQFAFADGSCRFIRENIENAVLQQLGNRADGKLLNGRY